MERSVDVELEQRRHGLLVAVYMVAREYRNALHHFTGAKRVKDLGRELDAAIKECEEFVDV